MHFHNWRRAFGTWNSAGECALVDTSLTYNECAALGQGIGNLTKAAFTYTNASCNYPSEPLRPLADMAPK